MSNYATTAPYNPNPPALPMYNTTIGMLPNLPMAASFTTMPYPYPMSQPIYGNNPPPYVSYVGPSAIPTAPSIPQHVLIQKDDHDVTSTAGKENPPLPKHLQHDYLAQRGNYVNTNEDPFWHGASALEQSLAACCDASGALRRDKVAPFLGRLCYHSHTGTLAAGALGLAILERSVQADAAEEQSLRASVQQWQRGARRKRARDDEEDPGERDDPDYSNHDDDDEERKITETAEESSTVTTPPPKSMDPQFRRPFWEVEPSRWQLFVRAGGLKIVSRWFIESAKVEKSSSIVAGPLLLPLLQFLFKAPLTVKEIKKHQLHILFKQWQDSLPNDPAMVPEDLVVAAKALKKLWKDKGKELPASSTLDDAMPKCDVIPDALQPARSLIADRLRVWEQYETSMLSGTTKEAAKPSGARWIANVLAEQRKKEDNPKKAKTSLSLSLMARRELAKEREANFKRCKEHYDDLAAARKEKLECARQLEAVRQRKQAPVEVERRSSGRTVRWKDGHDSKSLTKQKDLLEEVLIFLKDEETVIVVDDDLEDAVRNDDQDDDDDDDWMRMDRPEKRIPM
jgi:hypothetical protein